MRTVKTLTRRPTQFGRGNETIDARWLSSAKIRLIFLRSAEGEHLYTADAGAGASLAKAGLRQRMTKYTHGEPISKYTARKARVMSAPSLYSSRCVR
jgi:hypothetical protein